MADKSAELIVHDILELHESSLDIAHHARDADAIAADTAVAAATALAAAAATTIWVDHNFRTINK